MKSEHFETYQQGSRWWVALLDPAAPAWADRTSGATEAEALLAMCEQLLEDVEDAWSSAREAG